MVDLRLLGRLLYAQYIVGHILVDEYILRVVRPPGASVGDA